MTHAIVIKSRSHGQNSRFYPPRTARRGGPYGMKYKINFEDGK